jgi:Fe2+ transport system protein B
VVLDATCLERNLNLALQIMEITANVVVCVNLIDEARKKGIAVDTALLAKELGVPVVAAAARSGEGLDALRDTLYRVAAGILRPNPRQVAYPAAVEEAVAKLLPAVQRLAGLQLDPRWVALRFLDGDRALVESIAAWIDRRETAGTAVDAVREAAI